MIAMMPRIAMPILRRLLNGQPVLLHHISADKRTPMMIVAGQPGRRLVHIRTSPV
jgi:hypothetical protein